ncbi:MAG: phytoene/squalene synthase family protein [Proteobacteria bacterium]|nr:phytoene/squalene synthase family protein [Pseudomonadota bacterium]
MRRAWSSPHAPSAPSLLTPTPPLQALRDWQRCERLLQRGSKSFAAAALLLPPGLRADAAAIYAFCRIADDAVDCGADAQRALDALYQRLMRIYADRALDDPIDRAFRRAVAHRGIPQAIPAALLEGFAWDVERRRYRTLEELCAYGVRVAATVGVMMTLLLGRRDAALLARACDLGVAMQLTNIARDVGEDARQGRIYLPTAWLGELGFEPERWLARPQRDRTLAHVVERLLAAADQLYRRGETGIGGLPATSRAAIYAARLIYAEIGREIAAADYDTVTRRAVVPVARKAVLLTHALLGWPALPPLNAVAPLPAAAFLIAAVQQHDRAATPGARA